MWSIVCDCASVGAAFIVLTRDAAGLPPDLLVAAHGTNVIVRYMNCVFV